VRIALATLLLAMPALAAEPADLVLRGGEIRTMDPARPIARAIAIRGEKIVALDDVTIGPKTRVIELHGATVIPSLTDAHAHLSGLGLSLLDADLHGCKSADECAKRAAAAKPSQGDWIIGEGWDQNLFPDAKFPTHAPLDTIPHPVYLNRVDGHASWANAAAMRLARIDRNTKDPPGGKIVRDERGEPTGIFVDAARKLVQRVMPAVSRAELEAAILRAQDVALSVGLTEVHTMGADAATIAAYEQLAREGKLRIRVYAYASAVEAERLLARAPDRSVGMFTLRGIKLFADGALGSRGARLLAPYADDPQNSGLELTSGEKITAIARAAVAKGWQVTTHAIGDRANRDVLDAYAAAGVGAAQRFRIEHAQVVAPGDFARFAKLGVIASMQPTHATSDMAWAEARIGKERLKGAYAWRTMLSDQVRLAFGSDFPVEKPDVVAGIVAAVKRGNWTMEQHLTLDEALAAFTTGAAYAAFEEKWRGTAAPGMAADLTVLDGKFPDWKPTMTIVAGQIAWSSLREHP
jgi:predicted amidohydrolase YtcJ